ncbi:MAG: tetratricopeptide repeat protein [Candidatus Omnitrophota bacterium]|nr:tetratricopeptide repeat protein [Candidatus Omnitrophota bacterium]
MPKKKINKKDQAVFYLIAGISAALSIIFFIGLSAFYVQNIRLKSHEAALEKNIISLNENLQQCLLSEKGRTKAENDAASYLKWRYVLKDQVDQTARMFNDRINTMKGAKKDKSLTALLYYNLGLAHTINADFALALDAFEEAIKLDPSSGYSYYNLGLLYSAYKDDPKKALECYKKYMEISPKGLYAQTVKERIKTLERSMP